MRCVDMANLGARGEVAGTKWDTLRTADRLAQLVNGISKARVDADRLPQRLKPPDAANSTTGAL